MVFGWPSRKTSYLYLMYVSIASCMVSKQLVVWITCLNLYMLQNSYYRFTMPICMLNRICCMNGCGWNRMFKYMFTGDWLYMLFMHQACIYETKQQYVKSNKILTAVIAKGTFELPHQWHTERRYSGVPGKNECQAGISCVLCSETYTQLLRCND